MACVWKDPKSRYWRARYTDASGRRVNCSTKQTDHRRKAWEIADTRGKAAKKAQLTVVTLGESLNVHSIDSFFDEWLEARESIGRSEPTLMRYSGVVKRFLEHLGANRGTASLASLNAGELEVYRDAELAAGKSKTTVKALHTCAMARTRSRAILALERVCL